MDDRDPRPGKFDILLTFGDLVDARDKFVRGISHYEVILADRTGRKLKPLAMIRANTNGVSCCRHGKYKVALRFNMTDLRMYYPNGYIGTVNKLRIAVTPRSDHIYLPYLSFTGPIIDKTSGQIKIIAGSWHMKMPPGDAAGLSEHPRVNFALSTAFADTFGLNYDDVFINDITIKDGTEFRRLATSYDDNDPYDDSFVSVHAARRTSTGFCCPPTMLSFCDGPPCPVQMTVDYEVNTWDLTTVIKAPTYFVLTEFQANIQKEAARIGAPVNIDADTMKMEVPMATIAGRGGINSMTNTTTVRPKVVKPTADASQILLSWIAAIVAASSHLMF